MNIEIFREYCLSKKGVEETFPFGEDTLVFKVMGKVFAITSLENPNSINLKCDPDRSIEQRERHVEIQPGFHMNKKHWNTVTTNDGLREAMIRELIDHSYGLVVKGLKKSDRLLLEEL